MTPNDSPAETRDTTISELHRTREIIVDQFNGDLDALTADARLRQHLSGKKIIRRTARVTTGVGMTDKN